MPSHQGMLSLVWQSHGTYQKSKHTSLNPSMRSPTRLDVFWTLWQCWKFGSGERHFCSLLTKVEEFVFVFSVTVLCCLLLSLIVFVLKIGRKFLEQRIKSSVLC
jgi:hypothetical protein